MRVLARYLALASVVGLVLPLAGCTGSARTQITVASLPSAFPAPMYVAERDGTFEREGLEVTIVELQSGADGVAAAVSGSAQIADIGFDDLVTLAEEGEEGLVMVHNLVRRVTLALVMDQEVARERGVSRSSPLPERYAALRGLRLGVTSPGAASDRYLRYYLREAGLDPERDAEIIAIGDGSSLLAALETDQIDAYQLSPPTPYVAEAEGFGTILIDGAAGDVPALADFAYTGFAANREWARGNPDAVRAFTRALDTAMETVRADAAATAEQIADRMSEDDVGILRRTLEALMPALSTDGCFEAEAVRTTLTTMHDIGITPAAGDPAESALWTNEYNDC
ncbi:ABC transporter substrate-binding protein [Actinophytocola xanthii]|uniref:ABC transporter substrate-binding protein n=1 Tax=Actinophytocola xanthii TaxID=1912961 RepID=UPI0009FAC581|nr:ABC transporter substrate-binding protein [Actinophytocola xanthii]